MTMITRRAFLRSCGLAGLALSTPAWAAAQAQSLFDGQSLKGWHKPPKRIAHGTGGHWWVEDGVLLGEQDPPGSGNGGLLLSDEKFGDFDLQLEMLCDYGPDTGVFFRCTDQGAGFQMYVDYHEGGNVGHLRGELPGAFAMKPFQIFAQPGPDGQPKGFTTRPDARAEKWPRGVYESTCTAEQWVRAWRVKGWNTARVRCVGKYPQVTTWVNDLKVCHWNGETCSLPGYNKERVLETLGREGSIGLQIHGGKNAWPAGTKCRWRNLVINRL